MAQAEACIHADEGSLMPVEMRFPLDKSRAILNDMLSLTKGEPMTTHLSRIINAEYIRLA